MCRPGAPGTSCLLASMKSPLATDFKSGVHKVLRGDLQR